MSPTIFRTLIVLSILLPTAAGATDYIFPSLIPNSLSVEYEKLAPPSWVATPQWLPTFPFMLCILISWVGLVGLLFFKPWARSICLYFTALSLLVLPLVGPILSSGLASSLINTSWAIWGAVLTIAYYSPLAERFLENQTDER